MTKEKTMKIEDQLVSLELAKKMKELGFEQEGLFYWVGSDKRNMFISRETQRVLGSAPDLSLEKYEFVYSAYTVAELGEMLPKDFTTTKDRQGWQGLTLDSELLPHKGRIVLGSFADTEANARAKMLIYLAENNLITPKELK